MGDRHQQTYYPPPVAQGYNPADYQTQEQYGPLTTAPHRAPAGNYYPSSNDLHQPVGHLNPREDRGSHHHRHRSSSRSNRHERSDRSTSRSRSKSRTKSIGATAVGGAAGAFLGHNLGHNKLGTVGGLLIGAIGAHELEKQYEKHSEKKRYEEEGYSYGGGEYAHSNSHSSGRDRDRDRDRDSTKDRRRRSSANFVDGIKDKVSGFLDPDSSGASSDKRRSRSHVGSGRDGGSSRKDRDRDYGYDDGYNDDGARRERRGSRRDDY